MEQPTQPMLVQEPEVVFKDIKPDALVKQDNRITNGRWRMNLNQSRIFLTAVSMIEESDEEFEAYRIQGKQLKELLELKGNSLYDQLNKDVPKLMSTFIEIQHSEKDKEWISLVSSARYTNGDLYLKFSNEMKPYLLKLKGKFTQCKLMDAMKFKSMYALRLFLLLKQFDSTGWRFMKVDELRDSLNLNKTKDNELKADMYPKINDLKKRVIEPAVVELNKAGFKVVMNEIKESRKIVAFKFSWNGLHVIPDKVVFNPIDEKAARLLARMREVGLNDRQIKYIGSLVGQLLTNQELQQTVWAIEQGVLEKNIPKHKRGGYAYKTFQRKFNLPNF